MFKGGMRNLHKLGKLPYIIACVMRLLLCLPATSLFARHRRIALFVLSRRIALFVLSRRIALFVLSRRIALFAHHRCVALHAHHCSIALFALHRRITFFRIICASPPRFSGFVVPRAASASFCALFATSL